MAKKEPTHVEILRRTERNAVLVTNGTVASWMQGRCVRSDNTLTKWGEKIIAAATMTDAEARDYDRTIQKQREDREAQRQKEREEWLKAHNEQVDVIINKNCWQKGTEKAFKLWSGRLIFNIYRKQIREFFYLPTKLVTAEILDRTIKLTMPKWIYEQHQRNWELIEIR